MGLESNEETIPNHEEKIPKTKREYLNQYKMNQVYMRRF